MRGSPQLLAALSLFVSGVLFLAAPGMAATIHVPVDQPTIQEGIDAAAHGDTVLVAPGTYPEHDIVMRSGVVLLGNPDAPGEVVIDAQQLGRAILCQEIDGAAAVVGFTVTNGLVTGSAWIEIYGGGLLILHSSARIESCVFTGCEAEVAGGGVAVAYSESVIRGCVFVGNRGIDGGGLMIDYASPEVVDCVFYDNYAMVWGGAIMCENQSSPVFRGCTVVRNRGYQGGGIWCVAECHLTFENCLIAFSTRGEGLFIYDNPSVPSDAVLSCCDVYGNADGEYGGNIEDPTGTDGNISEDPLFCDPENDDFSLADLSPCLPGNNECGVQMGAYGVGCITSAVAGGAGETPGPGFLPGLVNPFAAGGGVGFRLVEEGAVTLSVFDASGRRVRELIRGETFAGGNHEVPWDGRDGAGRALRPGVYFLRLQAGGAVEGRAVVLL